MKNITTNSIKKKQKKNLSKLRPKTQMLKIMKGNTETSKMNLITIKPKAAIVVQSTIKVKEKDLKMKQTDILTMHNNIRGVWKLKESIYKEVLLAYCY